MRLITGRRDGQQMFYSLNRPEPMDLFASAESLLAATGNQVVLCPACGANATKNATVTKL